MPVTEAEEQQRRLYRRLARLVVRLAVIALLFFVVTFLPRPAGLSLWMGPLAGAVLVIVVLILVGSTLYDTLFFDRYWRAIDGK
ncbi:MAG: hypothetical protein CL878_15270 [Dehalococcoidia bacterium]|nr:hypothetical protein [Dehalococcoidia bacterium]